MTLLQRAFDPHTSSSRGAEVGRIRCLGDGLNRWAYSAWVELDPDPKNLTGGYICLLPKHDVLGDFDERTQREASLLDALASAGLPFRIPKVVAQVHLDGHLAVVETPVEGLPLDFKAPRPLHDAPWEIVSEVAAAIHAVRDPTVLALAGASVTRLQHAEQCLAVFEGLNKPLLREAHAWACEHLPPATPSVLLHGDLLGQNIMMPFEEPDDPPGVIDWHCASRGDPAYDLAITTRGLRRPFKQAGGMARLLEAYAKAGGEPLKPAAVHLHELCLAANWYRQSLDPETRVHPPEEELKRLGGIFRRATRNA